MKHLLRIVFFITCLAGSAVQAQNAARLPKGIQGLEQDQAIIDENWALADLHWLKLSAVFNVALMKRPRRTPNAEAMFLDSSWGQFNEALKSRDTGTIRQSFLAQRGVCMACHIAEKMPFLNDAPIFRDTAGFPQN
jgi:hypothetical protein